jgi:hypothetical protein
MPGSATFNSFKWAIHLSLVIAVSLAITTSNAQEPESSKPPWLQLNNQISLSTEWYDVNGIDNRQLPFTYIVQGAPTVQLGTTPVPFSFVFSSFSNTFQTPFNQMGASPKYKWIQIHAGYRNIVFSPFTLGGQRMLGGGIELTPGKWQIGFFYGMIRNAIKPDSTNQVTPPPGSFLFGPGYRRSGWGAKVGFGKMEKSNVTLSLFRARDNEKSLDTIYHSLVEPPQANFVIGLSWKIQITKRISWVNDVAASAYTRNTKQDDIDLGELSGNSTIAAIFIPKISSQYLTAAQSALQYQSKKLRISLKYRRLDPDFKSMGTYFLNSDLQELTLNPGWRMNNKLYLNGSIGLQQDNLNGFKQRTTRRLIYRIAADYNPLKWFGIGVQHSNFGITQSSLAPNIADTTLIRQVNVMYAVQPRFTFSKTKVVHVVQLNASHQALSNAFSGAFAPPNVNTNLFTAVYSFNLLKPGISITPSASYIEVNSSLFQNQSIGGSLGFSLPIKKIRLTWMNQGSYFANTVNDENGGKTLSVGTNLQYSLKNGMSFLGGIQYLNNEGSQSALLPAFQEMRFRLGFSWAVSKSIKTKKK